MIIWQYIIWRQIIKTIRINCNTWSNDTDFWFIFSSIKSLCVFLFWILYNVRFRFHSIWSISTYIFVIVEVWLALSYLTNISNRRNVEISLPLEDRTWQHLDQENLSFPELQIWNNSNFQIIFDHKSGINWWQKNFNRPNW